MDTVVACIWVIASISAVYAKSVGRPHAKNNQEGHYLKREQNREAKRPTLRRAGFWSVFREHGMQYIYHFNVTAALLNSHGFVTMLHCKNALKNDDKLMSGKRR